VSNRSGSTKLSLVPLLAILLGMLAFAGCASKQAHDGPPASGSAHPPRLPDDAVPRKEPRSRYGNPSSYEVFGVRYEVLQTSYGFKERGVASWYGKKFHGRKTSSQEPYNMYAMTAAHKTLPLPTYVRVRNLQNNKSIVVRVNDRGPFVDNRIIDLSYSAAIKLDMIGSGTGLVEITALSYDEPPAPVQQDVPTRAMTVAPQHTSMTCSCRSALSAMLRMRSAALPCCVTVASTTPSFTRTRTERPYFIEFESGRSKT